MTAKLHTGPVVFADGVHYPVGKDGEPDMSQPLRWTPDGYRDAEQGEQLHNDANHERALELDPGGES